MTAAKQGDSVKIHYTGTLTDGTVFDSSSGREPLVFTIGDGKVIPGFEEAVVGMAQGESKSVTIPSEKAYGPRNDALVIEVRREEIPANINPELNRQLEMGTPDGQVIVVRVVEVNDASVKLDANPPLAGKDLTFELELVEIA